MTMKRQTVFTILLAGILIGPFCLRTMWPSLEPYPAIMLPSGAGKLKLQPDEFSFSRLVVYGQDGENNKWTLVDPLKFLDPIPVWYLNDLAYRHFGLRERIDNIWIPKLGIFEIHWSRGTDKSRIETREWLQKKLSNLGFENSKFKVVIERVTIRRRTGNVLRTETKNEEVYLLN